MIPLCLHRKYVSADPLDNFSRTDPVVRCRFRIVEKQRVRFSARMIKRLICGGDGILIRLLINASVCYRFKCIPLIDHTPNGIREAVFFSAVQHYAGYRNLPFIRFTFRFCVNETCQKLSVSAGIRFFRRLISRLFRFCFLLLVR